MANHIHRFKLAGPNVADLALLLPSNAALVDSTNPSIYKDFQVSDTNANTLLDLTAEMARLGWVYDSIDPVTTPNQQTSTALSLTASDPRRVLWFDHFITGNAGVSGSFGAMGWKTQTTGTGPNITIVDGTSGRPGIVRMEGGTSAAARAAMMLGDSTIANTIFINASQNQIDWEWAVKPHNSIAITDLERLQLGLGSEWTLDAELLNGIYWRYTPGVDTFWSLVTANGGTRTVTPSSTSPVVGTWVRLGCTITFPGGVPTIQAKINGVAVGATWTTNIPAAAVSPGILIQSLGAIVLEPMIDVDLTYGYQDPL